VADVPVELEGEVQVRAAALRARARGRAERGEVEWSVRAGRDARVSLPGRLRGIPGDAALWETTGGVATSYGTDWSGSIIARVGPVAVNSESIYDAFGNPTLTTGALPKNHASTIGYRGQLVDTATSQVYLRNRFYSPDIGRFTRSDPARAGHAYAYASGDPVNAWDPMGLDWVHVRGNRVTYEPEEDSSARFAEWFLSADASFYARFMSYPVPRRYREYTIGTTDGFWVRLHGGGLVSLAGLKESASRVYSVGRNGKVDYELVNAAIRAAPLMPQQSGTPFHDLAIGATRAAYEPVGFLFKNVPESLACNRLLGTEYDTKDMRSEGMFADSMILQYVARRIDEGESHFKVGAKVGAQVFFRGNPISGSGFLGYDLGQGIYYDDMERVGGATYGLAMMRLSMEARTAPGGPKLGDVNPFSPAQWRMPTLGRAFGSMRQEYGRFMVHRLIRRLYRAAAER